MAPTKLSDADKQEIIALYRNLEETTADIASRYGISTTTVSRVLKQGMPAEEYEVLIQQKRSMTFKSQADAEEAALENGAIETVVDEAVVDEAVVKEATRSPDLPPKPIIRTPEAAKPEVKPPVEIPTPRRQRKRSVGVGLEAPMPVEEIVEVKIELAHSETASSNSTEVAAEGYSPQATALQEIFPEEVLKPADYDDEEDLEDDLDDDDLADGDLDDLDDEFDETGESDPFDRLDELQVQTKDIVQVLPLSEASIPKTFYLVVDRASELITRPLRDFAELGQIPTEEVQARTLPIFDNHRLAKRFLRRSQRVVKVPDGGRMLLKVSPYLQAKGITRLLIDGQLYSLN